MPGFAVAGVVVAAVGVISSFLGAKKAESAAKKAAREEARLEGLVTTEKIRQLKIEERRMRGDTRAGFAGPGGVQVDRGSPLAVLAEQAREFKTERGVVMQVGATKAAAALQRGQNLATQYRMGGYAAAAAGASNIFSILANRPKTVPTTTPGDN